MQIYPDSKCFKITSNTLYTWRNKWVWKFCEQKTRVELYLSSFLCQSGTRGSLLPSSANRPPRNRHPWRWPHAPNASYEQLQTGTLNYRTLPLYYYSIVSFEMTLKFRFIWSIENKLNFTLQSRAKRFGYGLTCTAFQTKGIILLNDEWFYYARTIYCLFYSVGEISWSLIQFPVAWFIHN